MSKHSLDITFLGTGTSSGVPMIACPCEVCHSSNKKDKRLRSSILIQSASTTLVIDTGPDFRYQMLRENVTQLDAILYTHAHKDHIAGMDDVRAFNFFYKKAMEVYADAPTITALKREFYYAFAEEKFPGLPVINLNPFNIESFMVQELLVQPIPVWHLRMPVWGFRIGDFTYITDANKIEETAKELIKGSKVLVLNALRKEPHISHFNLEEAIKLVQELKIPTAYFTHISHQMGKHITVSQELPEGIHLAYDGLKLQL